LALHRGQADLLLPPRQRRYPPGERARLAAAIVGHMQQHGPGGRASDIGKALGIPRLLFWSVVRMLRLTGRVVRDHRGAYRLPDAPARLPVTIRGRFELLLRRGPLTTEAAVEAIPAAPEQVARLTDRLQRRGVVRKIGVCGAWTLAR
jgi:DNA-binding IclR family transcriptional regulator